MDTSPPLEGKWKWVGIQNWDSVDYGQKSIRLVEVHNELAHQIWVQSDQSPNARKLLDKSEARKWREFSGAWPKVNEARRGPNELTHQIWVQPNGMGHGYHLNSSRPTRNRRHFADDIFKCFFLNENVWISIRPTISLKFVPKGPINNIPALVQIMAWRRSGDKPLSEPNDACSTDAYIYASLGLNELI